MWSRCSASGADCIGIPDANGATYNPGTADTGKSLRVTATATNKNGTAIATSAATPVIAGAAQPTTTATTTSAHHDEYHHDRRHHDRNDHNGNDHNRSDDRDDTQPHRPRTTSPSPQDWGIATGYQPLDDSDATLARYLDAIRALGVKYVRTDINLRQVFENPSNATNGLSSRTGTLPTVTSLPSRHGACVFCGSSPTRRTGQSPRGTPACGPHGRATLYLVWLHARSSSATTHGESRFTRSGTSRLLVVLRKHPQPAVHGRRRGAVRGHDARRLHRDEDARTGRNDHRPGPRAGRVIPASRRQRLDERAADLEKLYDPRIGNIKGHFDALSIHPYGDFIWGTDANRYFDYAGAVDDWVGWNKMYQTTPSIRSIMVANGDGDKKIWATEIGAPAKRDTEGSWTSGTGTSEAVESGIVGQVARRWKALPFAGGLMWYAGTDSSSAAVEGDRWGLLRSDWSPKPSYAAFRDAIAASGP